MKKAIAIILMTSMAIAMIATTTITAGALKLEKPVIGDALNILKHLAGMQQLTPAQMQLYDIDGTIGIGIGDALEIFKCLAGMDSVFGPGTFVPPPPPPPPKPSTSIMVKPSTFKFDDLQITIGRTIEWVVLENRFSKHNGANVAKIPITIKNLKKETHGLNMFYVNYFGSKGTQLDKISTYFMEDDVLWAGDMRSGATLRSYMHILYDGNGDYYVEFDNWSWSSKNKVEVKITIKK